MKWYDARELLPGNRIGYVITRCVNSDGTEFIYQAIYTRGEWKFLDEEYWTEHKPYDEKFQVTHWSDFPLFNHYGELS